MTIPMEHTNTLPLGSPQHQPQQPVDPWAGAYGTGWGNVPPTPPAIGSPAPPSRPEPKRPRWLAMTVVALVAGVAASGATIGLTNLGDSAPTVGTTVTKVVQGDSSSPDWTATAAAASASVVSIEVDAAQGQAEGSGVILDNAGHVVTNHHVVSALSNSQIWVTLSDRRRYQAKLVASDPGTDLAVLQLTNPPSNLVPIAFGDVSTLKVGQPVMALGNPLGLSETVTTGIISALDRPVVTTQTSNNNSPFAQSANTSNQVVTNAIQTNAAINPGNSGGALVNASGELIGITSSIATLGDGQSQSGNLGIGFAIPADQVKAVTDQLIAHGKATHAYLGVSTTDQQATVDGAAYVGAGVQSIASGTPAAGALQVGDVIIGVDDDPVTGSEGLIAQIRDRQAGDKVTLQVVRGGGTVSVPITLTVAPS